jgi:hypothetical protein
VFVAFGYPGKPPSGFEAPPVDEPPFDAPPPDAPPLDAPPFAAPPVAGIAPPVPAEPEAPPVAAPPLETCPPAALAPPAPFCRPPVAFDPASLSPDGADCSELQASAAATNRTAERFVCCIVTSSNRKRESRHRRF